MLLATIASDPTTAPETLAALAEHARPLRRLAVALLANPATPASALTSLPKDLVPRDFHRALRTAQPPDRARLLTHRGGALANMRHYTDLDATEIRAVVEADPQMTRELAEALAHNPATPHDLAERAICHLDRAGLRRGDFYEPPDAATLATLAFERGIGTEVLTDRARPSWWDRYLTDRATRSYTLGVVPEGPWRQIADATSDGELTTRCGPVAHAAVVARNMRLPQHDRLSAAEAAVRHQGGYELISHRAVLAEFDDASALAVVRAVLERPSNYDDEEQARLAHLLTGDALLDPNRSAQTISDLTDLVLPLPGVWGAHPRIAVHPNTPAEVRARALAHPTAFEPGEPELLTVAAAVAKDPVAGILTAPASALAGPRVQNCAPLLETHLARAYATLGWNPCPQHISAIVALEDTFHGTIGELLDAVDAITT